jgi:PAS domain S-box-containing protein
MTNSAEDRHKTREELLEEIQALRDRVLEIEGRHPPGTDGDIPAQEPSVLGRLELYETIVQSILTGVWVADENDRIRYANRAMGVIAGLDPAALLGLSVLDDLQPEAIRHFEPFYRGAREALRPVRYDAVPIRTPGGRDTWQSGWLIPIVRNGRYDGVICTVEDVTPARLAETRRRESEDQFAIIFRESPDPMGISSLSDGRYLDVNPAFERILGYPREETIGRTSVELGIWADPSDRQRLVERLREGKVVSDFELDLLARSGERLRFQISASIIQMGSQGTLLVAARNITARKRAEDALRASEAKFSTIFESSPEIISITSLDEGRYLEVNESFTRSMGYSREEALGRTVLDLGIWADLEDRSRLVDAVRSQGVVRNQEFDFRSRDGRGIHGLVSAEIIEIEGSPCLLTLIVDISGRKREERAMAFMNRIQDVFLKSTDETMYGAVLDILREALASPFGYFGYIDDDGSLVCPSMTTEIWDRCMMSHKTVVFPRELWGGMWGASLVEGETLVANGGLKAPEGHLPLFRAICVPVLFQGRVIGQIGLANKDTDYDEHDQAFLQRMAAFIGPILQAHVERKREEQERARAEEALRESEERFSSFMRHLPGFSHIKDRDRRIIYVNERFETHFGMPLPEWIGKRTEDIWSGGADVKMRLDDEAVLAEGCALDIEEEVLTRGELHTYRTVKFPIPRPDGSSWLGGISIDVTETRKAEKAVRESEAMFRGLVETAPVGIVISDGPGKTILSMNRKFFQTFGYSLEEISDLGQWWALAYPDAAYRQEIREVWLEGRTRALEAGSEFGPIEAWITCRDGSRRYASGLFSNLGHINAVFFVDITERKRAEEALRESETKYRTLVEHLPQNIFVKDRASIYLSCNGRFAGLVGLTPEEVVGRTDFDLFPNRQDARKYREDDRLVMETGVAHTLEEHYDHLGGRSWARTTKVPLRSEEGSVVGVVGIFEDITEWREAQERLRVSEERYRAVSDLSSDYSFAFRVNADQSVSLEWITDAFTRMTGIPGEDVMYPNAWLRVVYPEDIPLVHGVLSQLRSGRQVSYDARLLDRSGQPFWVRTYIRPELNEHGALVRFYGATRDIHQRKATEDALGKERERLARASLCGRVALWEWDVASGELSWSDIVDEMLGHEPGGFPRTLQGWEDHIHPEDRPAVRSRLEAYLASPGEEALEVEYRIRRRDGTYLWWHGTGRTSAVGGGVTFMSGACTDITERKEAEEQIMASLKEKEVLLQEVHHRVKNNLQVISSLLHLQSDDILDESARAAFSESRSRIHSISLIHERLYRSHDLARIDIAEYTESLCQSLLGSHGARARVTGTVDMPNLSLSLDLAVPCALIINELVLNCLKHAFPEGREGELRITMEEAGDLLVLRIKDNGVGFPEGLDLADAPSLGMTIVATLVRQLKGRLDLKTGNGAEVVVTFPSGGRPQGDVVD